MPSVLVSLVDSTPNGFEIEIEVGKLDGRIRFGKKIDIDSCTSMMSPSSVGWKVVPLDESRSGVRWPLLSAGFMKGLSIFMD